MLLTGSQSSPINSGVPAWVAFDFINSLIIINGSLYFSAWITQDQQVNSFWYGFTFSISTLLLLLLLPAKGALLDRFGWGRPLLLVTSILIALSSILLFPLGHRNEWLWRVVGTLVLFGLINLLYQASLVSYNWLLPHLRGVEGAVDIRRVSGWGEAAGSLGSVVGALLGATLLNTFLQNSASRRIDLFLYLGLMFFVLFILDYAVLRRGIVEHEIKQDSESFMRLVRSSFNLLRTRSETRRFLFSFLLFADALLTVQLYLPIFMRERLALDDASSSIAFALSLTAAALGATAFSYWGRRKSPKRTIQFCLVAWVLTLAAFSVIEDRRMFLGLMIVAGIEYGVLWSAARAYIIELTPRTHLGRTLGFFAVFERCASIIGPLLWGSVMLLPLNIPGRYLVAFNMMAVLVLAAVLILATSKSDSSMITSSTP